MPHVWVPCLSQLMQNAAEGLRYEKREFWSCFALDDQKEGMAAFIQKRAPEWRHS